MMLQESGNVTLGRYSMKKPQNLRIYINFRIYITNYITNPGKGILHWTPSQTGYPLDKNRSWGGCRVVQLEVPHNLRERGKEIAGGNYRHSRPLYSMKSRMIAVGLLCYTITRNV